MFALSEGPISFFDIKSRFPKGLDPSFMDFEWSLYAGFPSQAIREEFLIILKSGLRDSWYNEILNNSIEKLSPEKHRFPLMGELQVFASDAKNIGLSEYKDFINKSGLRKNITSSLNVLLSFKAPSSLKGNYNSLIIEEKEIEATEKNFLKCKASVKHKLNEDLSWVTSEFPGGEKVIMGDVAEVPDSNILLRVKLSIPYKEGESAQEYVFGEAE